MTTTTRAPPGPPEVDALSIEWTCAECLHDLRKPPMPLLCPACLSPVCLWGVRASADPIEELRCLVERSSRHFIAPWQQTRPTKERTRDGGRTRRDPSRAGGN